MKKQENEKIIFEAFQAAMLDFAGRLVESKLGADPPDFLCVDKEGKRIGIELVEWLNEEQMKAAKVREKMQSSYLDAVRSKEVHPPQNIGLVWLHPKSNVALSSEHFIHFRNEILKLIEVIDSECETPQKENFQQPHFFQEFSSYPTLSKYLSCIEILPRTKFPAFLGCLWICFPPLVEAYTPNSSVDALLANLQKKTAKYQDLCVDEKLDEVYLLIYYANAMLYNTPFDAPDFGFDDIVKIASDTLAQNHGILKKVFLFDARLPHQQAKRIWP